MVILFLHKIRIRVIKVFSFLSTRILAFLWKINIGRKCTFDGIPTFYKTPGSKISFGDGCRFNSRHTSNFRGLSHPCIFQTGKSGASIEIGNNVGFSGVSIVCDNRVLIEDNCLIGANTKIGDRDDHESIYGIMPKPIIIKKGSWIGMNCTILKGVTIGENVIIGACSVVTKDIPDNCIAVGNPCKVIKCRS